MHTNNQTRKRNIIDIVLVVIILALVVTNVITFSKLRENHAYVIYSTPEGEIKKGPYVTGSVAEIEDGPVIDGYTFIGWRDADGNMEKRNEVYVNEDTYYSAVYSVGLDKDDHIVYLENDNGLFRPYDSLTRRECALMFYKLMNISKTGKGEFKDVKKDDPCYTACATLKDLGVISGNFFHPDDPVSRRDFAEILSCFIPDYEKYMDNTQSDEYLQRYETAVIMNKVLDRHGDTKNRTSMTGTFLDLSSNTDYFWDVAEATLEHKYTSDDGKETWTSCNALPSYEPGFFFVGPALHYIDEKGNPVISASAQGLDFNKKGEVTSGDDEVDKGIHEIISEVIDFEKMDKNDMRHALFDYMVDENNFKYMTRNYYGYEDVSWLLDEAKVMLETRKGNCYNFTAVFYYLMRAIGFNPVAYSGTVGSDNRPHAWTEMEKNGQNFLYDVEYQYANPGSNTYQRDQNYMDRYHYRRVPRTSSDSTTG